MDIGIYSSEGYFENGMDLGLSRDFVDSCDGVWWRVSFDNRSIIVAGFFWVIKPNREGRWERVVVCSRIPYTYSESLVDLLCEFFKSAKRELDKYGYVNKIDGSSTTVEHKDISSNIIYKMIKSKRKGFDILVNLQKSISITSNEKEPSTSEKISYGYYVLWIFEHLKDFLKIYKIDIALSKMKISNSINFNEQTGDKLEDLVRKKLIYGEEYLKIIYTNKASLLKYEFNKLDDEIWIYLIMKYIKSGRFDELLKKYRDNPDKLAKICYALGRSIKKCPEIINELKSNNLYILLYAFKSKLVKSKEYKKYIGIGLQHIYSSCNPKKRVEILNEIFNKQIWDLSLKNKVSKLINNPHLLNQIHDDTNVITKIKDDFINLNKKVEKANPFGIDLIEVILIIMIICAFILTVNIWLSWISENVVNPISTWISEHIINPISNFSLAGGGNNTTSEIVNNTTTPYNASVGENVSNINNTQLNVSNTTVENNSSILSTIISMVKKILP